LGSRSGNEPVEVDDDVVVVLGGGGTAPAIKSAKALAPGPLVARK
jgi:shikimate 5-dehydrogenase